MPILSQSHCQVVRPLARPPGPPLMSPIGASLFALGTDMARAYLPASPHVPRPKDSISYAPPSDYGATHDEHDRRGVAGD